MDGAIGNKKFCFLWHSSKLDEEEEEEDKDDDEDDRNFYKLLIYLLDKIIINLKKSSSLEPNAIDNLTLLIAGGVVDEHQLTRKAYGLLNETIDSTLIEHLTTNTDVLNLFKKLQNSVIIISPVTYLLPDNIEDQGE